MVAKLYGNLAGQPVHALMSGLIGIVPSVCKDSTDLVLARDYVTLNNNVIGDQVSLGAFKSTAFIDFGSSWLLCDALGAGCTVNVGDATYPSGLIVMNVQSWGWKPLQSLDAGNPGGVGWALWQRLGYPADPNRLIELLAVFAGANPANGGLGWDFRGQP